MADQQGKGEIWRRLPNESDDAWAAFLIYRDMQGGSIDKAFREWRRRRDEAEGRPVDQELENRRADGRWFDWSRDWQWDLRRRAYQAHMHDLQQQTTEAAVVEVVQNVVQDWAARQEQQRQQMWEMGQELLAKAGDMLKFPLAVVQQTSQVQNGEDGKQTVIQTTIVNPARWGMRDAASVVKVAAELLQAATGYTPTETGAGGGADTAMVQTGPPPANQAALLAEMERVLRSADHSKRAAIIKQYETMMRAAQELQRELQGGAG